MDASRQQTLDRLLEATGAVESRHFWFRGFRRFVGPLVARAVRNRPRPRVLDCGCGTGSSLEWLRQFGAVVGVDGSAAGLALARRAGRGPLVRADVTALPFPASSFDLITSFDVLYSLDPPAEAAALAEIFRLLSPGGALVVSVAAMHVLSGDHSAFSAEARRYTRAELQRALTRAGFRVIRLAYTNASLVPALLVTRWIQRRRGLRAAPGDMRLPPAPVNALLTGILALEARWARRFPLPFGSSLMALATKPERS